jgi:predicted methyltransferase
MRAYVLLCLGALAAVFVACSRPEDSAEPQAAAPEQALTPATPPAETSAAPAPAAGGIAAALTAPGRLPEDRDADANRKPAEVLEFFGLKPGMMVLDLFSGGGYYTEIMAHVVRPDGRVDAHNNTPYLSFVGDELDRRYADPARLPNVRRFIAENNALELEDGVYDFVLMSLVYHDVYLTADGWERIDAPKMLAEIYASMKPGAVLGVIDHVAQAGAPPETGGTLHRIDPELLKRDITSAGFVLEGESDVLRNPADDHTLSVFEDAIRGRTDRVVLRFRKPAG